MLLQPLACRTSGFCGGEVPLLSLNLVSKLLYLASKLLYCFKLLLLCQRDVSRNAAKSAGVWHLSVCLSKSAKYSSPLVK